MKYWKVFEFVFVPKRFWSFGFSQFHRDWLNHRGGEAWKDVFKFLSPKTLVWKLVGKKRWNSLKNFHLKNNVSKFFYRNSHLKTWLKRMFKLLISEEIEKFKKSKNKSWRNPKKHWLYKSKSERVREGAQQIHFHISGVGKIWSVRKWQKIDPGPLVGRGILVVIHPNSSKHYNSCMAWGGEQGKGGVEERDEKKEEKEGKK